MSKHNPRNTYPYRPYHRCPTKISATSRVTALPYLHELQLAHPVNTDGDFNISLLIRADHYWDIVEDHIIRGGPTAISSKIGYLLSGPVSHTHSLNVVTSALHISTRHNEDHNIQKFYDLEITGIAVENNSDKQFLQEYSRTCIIRLPDGSYCTRFPWKESLQLIPMYAGREPIHWLTVFHKHQVSYNIQQHYL